MSALRSRLAALALAVLWAAAAPAQDAPPMPPEEVIATAREGERLMAEGDVDGAYARLAAANDATFAFEDYAPEVKYYPNLAFARYYRELGNWDEVARFAASVASALDYDEMIDHPFRVESVLLLGIAFYELGQGSRAEPPLRTAFAATEATPDLAGLHALAAYYLALLLTDYDADEAESYRYHFFNLDLDGTPVTPAMTAWLVYRNVMEARNRGDDLAGLIENMEYLLSVVEPLPDVDPERKSFYRGFLGLLLAENGQYGRALGIFRERHRYLLANGPIDIDFYWNAQRLAMLTSITGNNVEARRFLREQLAYARDHDADPYILSFFNRNLGEFSDNLGETATAQLHYRAAYSDLRQIRRANDPEVLEIRALIDLRARDIRSFSFAPELGVVGDVEFELRPDAADVIRMFFEGQYVTLKAVLDSRAEADGADTALFQTNLAMYHALAGDYDACIRAVRRARQLVVLDPAGQVAAGDPVLDLIEAIARVWTSAHQRASGRDLLVALGARVRALGPEQRSMYLALEIFAAFQEGTPDLIPTLFDRWIADWRAIQTRGPWAIAGATFAIEAGLGAVSPDLTDEAMAATFADIRAQGSMTLARDYIRLAHFLNGQTAIYDDEALTELGLLARAIALQVPADHGMVSASQFGLANALRWRGRNGEALDWMRQATDTLRSNPYHAVDTLAFLLSEQALLLSLTGDDAAAASMAKEAYDMIDLQVARPDLAGGVVESYAYTVWRRTGNATRAAAIYRRHVDDAAFFGRLAAIHKVRLLKAYADALSSEGTLEDVRTLLDRAEATVPDDFNDWRPDRSSILWSRAIAEFYNDAHAEAFAHMRASNDMAKAWNDDQIAAGAVSELGASDAHDRAVWEAVIGWDYAQTLAE